MGKLNASYIKTITAFTCNQNDSAYFLILRELHQIQNDKHMGSVICRKQRDGTSCLRRCGRILRSTEMCKEGGSTCMNTIRTCPPHKQ